MFLIKRKEVLNDSVSLIEIEAPLIARKVQPGQFVIIRVNNNGERIPFTIADSDIENGTVTIIFQKVGATTYLLDELKENDYISDIVGPLGVPSDLSDIKNAAVIGGGLGVAIAYPQAKALHKLGANVDLIVGFRNKDLIILEDELKDACSNLIIMTDDGSNGNKGFVTAALESEIKNGKKYDAVIAIGPMPMMKAVSELTRPYGIKTIVSMNSIMIDGTGMCGCCRVIVDGKTKFACVDGPDFDGHLVDFDNAILRSRAFKPQEQESIEHHRCRLTGGVK